MASLIPGFEYDIFISYRQKDNKGDRWVSEFVDALKTELESTFKEEISVYFDINPHDGLLETHDVDASLKEKLKCLVFIPIISRTYCDPKSFAWEHEFKEFVEQASHDQFGLKVKLPNGNVANRVLPIQIHEISVDDKANIEKELGGVLRPIEFIYKEPGVNRPLRGNEDHPDNNLNKSFYRNQINKVANAIDELISSFKNLQTAPIKEKTSLREPLEEVKKEKRIEGQEKPAKLPKRKLLTGGILLAVLLVIAAIFAYPKIFKRNKLENLKPSDERLSVAVMPFQNMTNDTTWNIWQTGIQDMLINYLSNSPEELKVRQTELINGFLKNKGVTDYATLTHSVAGTVAQKLDASIVICGSIKQEGATIRVNTQLIDSKTEEIIKPFQITGTSVNIMHIIDSLSLRVKNYLIITKLGKAVTPEIQTDLEYFGSTNSPEAYRYSLYGNNALTKGDFSTAMKWFSQSIAIDSNFFYPSLGLLSAEMSLGMFDKGKEQLIKIYKQKDLLPLKQRISLSMLYSIIFETPEEEIKYIRQAQSIDDQDPSYYLTLASYYDILLQYNKSIPEYEKVLEIYNKWDSMPPVYLYPTLGLAYHETGQFNKEEKLYKKAKQDFPDIDTRPDLGFFNNCYNLRQAVLLFTEGKKKAANKYIEKYISLRKTHSDSESDIATGLASIYSKAGILDRAEEYYRKALSLDPDNPQKMDGLGYFLIDKDRNINEGLELNNKALAINPPNLAFYLDTKGWGLYKQGKYKEALEILQRGWDLRPYYSQIGYNHLDSAKKAVASQK